MTRAAGIPDDPWKRRRAVYYPEWATQTQPQASVTDNPVIHTLLGPKGETIRQWTERPPVGFRKDGPA